MGVLPYCLVSERLKEVRSFEVGHELAVSLIHGQYQEPAVKLYDGFRRYIYTLNWSNTLIREFHQNPAQDDFKHLEVADPHGRWHKLPCRKDLTEILYQEYFPWLSMPEVDVATYNWKRHQIGKSAVEACLAENGDQPKVIAGSCEDHLGAERSFQQLQLLSTDPPTTTDGWPGDTIAEFQVSQREVSDSLHGARKQPVVLGLNRRDQICHVFHWNNTRLSTFMTDQTTNFDHVRTVAGGCRRLQVDGHNLELFFDNNFTSEYRPQVNQDSYIWFQQTGQVALEALTDIPSRL